MHQANALQANANYLLTTDRKMLKSKVEGIRIVNPVELVFILSEVELP